MIRVNGSNNRLVGTGATLNHTGGSNYTLGNLTSATDSPGAYSLSFVSFPTLTDRAGNALATVSFQTWNQTLTYTNQPVLVRLGQFVGGTRVDSVVQATATGTVVIGAGVGSITKTGAGTLKLANASDPGDRRVSVTFNANEGTTRFEVDPGSATLANWSLYAMDRVEISVPTGHRWNAVTVGLNGTLSNLAGTMVTDSLSIMRPAAAPLVQSGGSIVHDSNGTDVAVQFTFGGVTIGGTATGPVYLMHDTSDSTATLRKFGSGTFKLTNVSHPTVAVNFVNEEGKTEFRTNTGNVAQAGGVNWSVTVNETPGMAQSSVEFYTVQNLKALAIHNDAVATIVETAGSTSNVLVAGSLWIDPRGKLDVKNNDVVLKADAATKEEAYGWVFGWIAAGRNGVDANSITNWNGYGIVSTSARAFNVTNGWDLHSVGSITNEDLNVVTGLPGSAYSTFSGQTVAPEYILIKYTYVGDANLDGQITFDDYAGVDNAFAGVLPNMGWITGDVDYDGDIDFSDLSAIDNAFYFQGDPL